MGNLDTVYNGLTYRQWMFHTLGWTPQQYKTHMIDARASGLDPNTFAGALEAGAIATFTMCHVHIFEQVRGGFQRINEAVPPGAESVRAVPAGAGHVCVVWNGLHYDALILAPP